MTNIIIMDDLAGGSILTEEEEEEIKRLYKELSSHSLKPKEKRNA